MLTHHYSYEYFFLKTHSGSRVFTSHRAPSTLCWGANGVRWYIPYRCMVLGSVQNLSRLWDRRA